MLSLLCASASLAAANAAAQFSASTVNGHRVEVSEIDKSARKWLLFPDQKELHTAAMINGAVDGEILKPDQSFWSQFRDVFGLNKETQMVVTRTTTSKEAATSTLRFDQVYNGLRVFGGECQLTVGRHGGVLFAQGLPLKLANMPSYDFASLEAAFDADKVVSAVELYLLTRFGEEVEMNLLKPMVPMWHNSLVTVAKEGKMRVAYLVQGKTMITSTKESVTFDCFVDANELEVVEFIELSSRAETSPFSSPILDADIYVYDQYKKDYNDDVADDDQNPDPDRYSNATLVFTTDPVDTYPTTDYEMNDLIDNTLYVKYLFYSLSSGEYLTWNLTDTPLNIEYNLSIANAYFDGTWGIHFGTGYITDDVVPHEWTHGYTQTGCGLIYAYESGAMNEAFSDIYGESVDILNHDTSDPNTLRTQWPQTCHMTLNNAYGIPPGNDFGTRWSMGENVTTTYPNGDGSIRDMYMPECFFQPSTTDADYYHCTTYYDNGGVHKNSGVLNRLFAVLTDGGQYADPTSTTGATLTVAPLGFVKSTNLFWRAHQELTPTSQYMDFAITINQMCSLNIGKLLYFPNLFNSSLIPSTETLTAADCENVKVALAGSGMDSNADFCPNIDCNPNNQYSCAWANCPASDTELSYEELGYLMGNSGIGSLAAICSNVVDGVSTYARVFNQTEIPDDFGVGCIQIGYFMMGQTEVTLEVYIDSDGGAPNVDSLRLVTSVDVTTVNAYGNMQVQTASFPNNVKVQFNDPSETLVVVLKTTTMSEGFIIGGGYPNREAVNTIGQTYVGGSCVADFVAWNTYAATFPSLATTVNNQWFVSVNGLSSYTPSSEDDDDEELSDGALAGIVIGSVAGAGIIGGLVYYGMNKGANQDLNKNLI